MLIKSVAQRGSSCNGFYILKLFLELSETGNQFSDHITVLKVVSNIPRRHKVYFIRCKIQIVRQITAFDDILHYTHRGKMMREKFKHARNVRAQ